MNQRVTILFSIDSYHVFDRKPCIIWNTIDIVDQRELSKFPKFLDADIRMLSSSVDGTSLNTAFRAEVDMLNGFLIRQLVKKKLEDVCPRWCGLSVLSQIFVVFNDINLAYKFEGSTHPKSSSKAYQLIVNQLFDADIVRPCMESARCHD